ncbi:VRR-NUC domain-containing protein [Tropicimonas isoalkanivorans]|uniref:VRR-NUC domain-containing protein n=1 Tax=Tropicimonas isoalkanivorans TaxID=441112 RepID=A0A1I1J7X1_9RHOB|nr:VRR-NUC domain-containing protein [Tropicimonas isoalkanivorans]SFC44546.1 hypothetical protein SAMN04488094_1059 [Tropicimonas isoalkanivorans]
MDAPSAISGRRGNPEADIQRLIVRTLRAVLPRGAIVHHSANEIRGGPNAQRAQAINVGMGVHPGFSDLLVISEGQVLFLEVKSKTGRLSERQAAFRDLVRAQGLAWAMVRSVDEALGALAEHGFRTRIAGARR